MTSCREYRPDFYNALIFLAFTGCRTGEMYGLRNSPADINATMKTVWVTGKGAKRRPFRLTGPIDPAWRAVEEQQRQTLAGERLWPYHRMWAHDALSRVACEAFGYREVRRNTKKKDATQVRHEPLRPAHPHMLRHSLASMALLRFTPPWTVEFLAKWLGHADISTTFRIYSHWIAPEAPSGYGIGYDPLPATTLTTKRLQRRKNDVR